ncbi:MAG: hypothetical protein KF897_15050 [Opitutaceae bacterium]|nr:hypothetical protein [Opitutaceae bacterium]
MKKLLILFPLLVTIALGQPASVTPTNQTLMVNGTTGAIAAPVSSATFISANGLITASTVNGYFADPSTNGSFSASAWRTDLSVLTAAEIAAAYQPLDSDLTAIAALTTTSYGRSFLDRADAAAARTLMGVVIGTDVQAYDVDLSAFGNLATTGLVARTGSGTAATRTLTAPAAGITVTNGDGVSGNPTLALANDLAGIEGLAANGLATRTATDTWTNRTIAGTSPISVSNGDGVAGNPTISVSAASTSAAGVVELATTAESLAGTDSARAPSVNSQEARVLNGTIDRANAPNLYSDGATSGRYASATFGAAGVVGGMPVTFLFEFEVPTSTPTTDHVLCAFAPAAATSPSQYGNSLTISFQTDGLRIRQNGASASDYRMFRHGTFLSTYAGRRVKGVVAFESADTTTNPKVYLNGVDASASFAVVTGGTVPNWIPSALGTTYFLSGYNLPACRFVPHAPELGAWTATQALEWTQTGRKPASSETGTGSAVATYTSDFSAGLASWSADGGGLGANVTNTGNIDTDADGAGIPPSDNWQKSLRSSTTGAIGFFGPSATNLSPGRKYRITASVFIPTGSTITGVVLYGYNGSATSTYSTVLVTAGSVNIVAWEVVPTLTETPWIRPSASVAAGTAAYLKDFKIYSAGPLAKWEIQPVDISLGGVARDAGANNIPLVLVPGITPITTSNRGTISATLTWSGTHEAKSIIGQAALPSNARVDYITSKATAASTGSGMTVGSVTTPALLVAANTYTTAKKDHTLAARLPAGTASNDLNLVVDPDTNNYTGSITVTIGYTTTISTP